ncbi:MAG TPA: glycosyltransferase [Acidiphilium sp.]|jgi:GT2 family glycosyltransferase|uniref:glycosyltransferase family 2 protein n=1 Tax=unclassified Acidiphilium TaxID=2617493 RepID=UPI000BD680EB|nr:MULTISPECIES: glycosyltransferase [unclassified Acidiphilium]OYV55715.1 MAG: glycosyl transferase [Acidiphilium sp. 20-67-58]OYV87712.1 MAG: glycosyl transferase [Acidiphilium sp. 21-68-69]HQT60780.1 glycosyltransferase [Acidiphilium sp.]HQU10698.1 glycosyltransferase [Acidiphilium sp.]
MPSEPHLLAGTPPPGRAYDADIVILSHQRPRETIAALRSAASQTGMDSHVIILDQASDAAMRAALTAAAQDYENVAVYGVARNLGVPGGRNLAATLGRGRTIISLDNDAVFADRDTAAHAARRIAGADRLGAIGFRILAADGACLDRTSWGYPARLVRQAERRFTATTFVGCGHALSRACFEQLGGYDATLFFAWEEYEFARRAIAAGWKIEHHGDLAVVHAVSPEARMGWSAGRWRHFVRNRLLIAHDWDGPAGFWLRAGVYLARGAMTSRLGQTLGAIAEARVLSRTRPRQGNTAAARRYVFLHETCNRLPCTARFRARYTIKKPHPIG